MILFYDSNVTNHPSVSGTAHYPNSLDNDAQQGILIVEITVTILQITSNSLLI